MSKNIGMVVGKHIEALIHVYNSEIAGGKDTPRELIHNLGALHMARRLLLNAEEINIKMLDTMCYNILMAESALPQAPAKAPASAPAGAPL